MKAKKHIRIEHPELIKRKVELWLPLDGSTSLKYDSFFYKVQDLLQVHLGTEEVLTKMKSLNGGRPIDNDTALDEEIEKGTVIEAYTRTVKTSKCFCF